MLFGSLSLSSSLPRSAALSVQAISIRLILLFFFFDHIIEPSFLSKCFVSGYVSSRCTIGARPPRVRLRFWMRWLVFLLRLTLCALGICSQAAASGAAGATVYMLCMFHLMYSGRQPVNNVRYMWRSASAGVSWSQRRGKINRMIVIEDGVRCCCCCCC